MLLRYAPGSMRKEEDGFILNPVTAFNIDKLSNNNNFETGNANGWTTNGDVQVLNDCCTLNNVPSNYDLEFGDSGSIEQQFNLTTDTISQAMLDNGIKVEPGSGAAAASKYWSSNQEILNE